MKWIFIILYPSFYSKVDCLNTASNEVISLFSTCFCNSAQRFSSLSTSTFSSTLNWTSFSCIQRWSFDFAAHLICSDTSCKMLSSVLTDTTYGHYFTEGRRKNQWNHFFNRNKLLIPLYAIWRKVGGTYGLTVQRSNLNNCAILYNYLSQIVWEIVRHTSHCVVTGTRRIITYLCHTAEPRNIQRGDYESRESKRIWNIFADRRTCTGSCMRIVRWTLTA